MSANEIVMFSAALTVVLMVIRLSEVIFPRVAAMFRADV